MVNIYPHWIFSHFLCDNEKRLNLISSISSFLIIDRITRHKRYGRYRHQQHLASICFSSSAEPKLNCILFRIGYGIGLSKGSPWRDKISLAILEMQEKGEIQMLYDKWWKKSEETCVRDEKQKETTTRANSLVCKKYLILSSFLPVLKQQKQFK